MRHVDPSRRRVLTCAQSLGLLRIWREPHSATKVVPWEWLVEDYSRIRDKIEAVFPIFERFNARIKVPGGFHLANTASQRIWKTSNGKANFVFP